MPTAELQYFWQLRVELDINRLSRLFHLGWKFAGSQESFIER